jgi:hypothetical protein
LEVVAFFERVAVELQQQRELERNRKRVGGIVQPLATDSGKHATESL